MNDGGPAFPLPPDREHTGMMLREWYAGMALQAIIISDQNQQSAKMTAADAFEYADAMIAQSTKGGPA